MRQFTTIYTPTNPLFQQFPKLEANQLQCHTLTMSLKRKKEDPCSTGYLKAEKSRNLAGEDFPCLQCRAQKHIHKGMHDMRHCQN